MYFKRIFLASATCVWLATAVGLVLFTTVGIAPTVYNAVADESLNMAGNGAAALTAFSLACAFVLDFYLMPPVLQVFLAVVFAGLAFATAVLKAIAYPYAPGLLCIGLPLAYLGFLRVRVFPPSRVSGTEFLRPLSATFGATCVGVVVVWCAWIFLTDRGWSTETKIWLTEQNSEVFSYLWHNGTTPLVYTTHCGSGSDTSWFSLSEQTAIQAACTKAANVWFLQWAGPFAIILCSGVEAALAFIFAQVSRKLVRGNPAEDADDVDGVAYLKQVLKGCLLMIVMVLAAMYAAATYVSGSAVALSSAIFCLGALTMAATVGWMYAEIDHTKLKRLATEGRMAASILKIMKSDWVRAMAVGGLTVFIPLLAALDMIRQSMRKLRGTVQGGDGAQNDRFTPTGRKVVDECSTWNWCGILQKVILLGELVIAIILGMKATYVFFSWLNTTLYVANFDFWVLTAMVFGIGLAMFMCPIVPGSAVYLFAGVVLGAQSQLEGRPGFAIGITAGVVASSIAKHIACVGQYMIGYYAGKLVKVQQMVGVDQVPARATEKILKTPGLGLGKVCILIAGPDFPTSVLCGILKLNIPQMLLGTTPIVLVSIIPQVATGALLTYNPDAESESNIQSLVSGAVTGFAAAIQASAVLLFTWRIMKTVEQDGDELAKPRPEHEAVAKLTAKEAEYTAAFKQVSQWQVMTCTQLSTLLLAVASIVSSGFVIAADFMIADKFCFRNFSITNKISDPIDLGGLDNSAWNIVIVPIGWLALAVAVLGVACQIIFGIIIARATRAFMKENGGSAPAPCIVGREQEGQEKVAREDEVVVEPQGCMKCSCSAAVAVLLRCFGCNSKSS
ncbi:unnamed protein product [Symbiodinium sp. CCMP2592]|nr:unnamed protein product [Symbiodinium sp. CCMP2592]